jgi:hypothetical protein
VLLYGVYHKALVTSLPLIQVIYQTLLFNALILSLGCIEVAHFEAHCLIVSKSEMVSCLVAKSCFVAITVVSTLISLVFWSISIQVHSTNFFWYSLKSMLHHKASHSVQFQATLVQAGNTGAVVCSLITL